MPVQAVGSLPRLHRLYDLYHGCTAVEFFNDFTGCRIFTITVQAVGFLPSLYRL